MTLPIENHIEMVRLVGNTPDEIAQDYARVFNERCKNPEVRYSVFHGEMMRYGPSSSAPRQIEGEWYCEMEYGFFHDPTNEEEEEV